ncbi:hypothetical protein Y032_0375g227 [Ancylostoma ceylanicum]|uniref:Uncharacterized protein n=1 Tax=Ancylostoma ceylanicum TaxID=53326 RepID=A0A016RTT1_9BILA|nr:hypothetical protein Y032_0375g227 [Ancylostoma ceylanicum]
MENYTTRSHLQPGHTAAIWSSCDGRQASRGASAMVRSRSSCQRRYAKGDKVCRIGYDLDVPGKRPKGRPKQRLLDTLHADLKAHDMAILRQRINEADAVTKREKR